MMQMMLGFRRGFESVVLAMVFLHVGITVTVGSFFEPFNVSYDHRALILGGRRRMLISAGIHYPRATPEMWPDIIAKSKEGGADAVETYVFWNGHEPVRGQYNFEGRFNLVKFVKLVGAHGLYLHLRIGPYACAEWNFGGFPVWLRDIPGIEFRTDNAPFKLEMQRFVKKIVDLMKEEMFFSWQGGPIILLQIENEYGNIESSYGQGGKDYIKWAANMALGLGAGVPWVMCRQTDAPETIIDTCNAYYCDGFRPNSYKKPALWTEDWDGWYASWGGRLPRRPVEDNAFAVARFFQRGGSFHNYYMFFGGTNFGKTAGGPLQITSYDYDAPVDEYGLLSQPKWGHLNELHAVIKLCEPALVAVDDGPHYIKLGPKQEAHVYSRSAHVLNSSLSENSNKCCAFLANIDDRSSARVNFHGRAYTLPPWSVSVLPDCKNVAFNTAKVGAQVSIKTVETETIDTSNITEFGSLLLHNEDDFVSKEWVTFEEPIGLWGENNFSAQGIIDHLNVTKDISDYLWYIIRVQVSEEDISFWEENDVIPSLKFDSIRDVVRIFVNGHLAGSKVGKWVPVEQPLHLIQGYNEISILTETVGLQNYGAFLERDGAGLRGHVNLTGMKSGDHDLSNSLWTYQVGLKGEYLKLYSLEPHGSVYWSDFKLNSTQRPFMWYKTFFDSPTGNEPIALDLGSMGKGQAWVNGHHIGRYWLLSSPKDGCSRVCDYRGTYDNDKCMKNCGKPTQSWYHVPRSWLKPSNNLLVLFEETGGNPFDITIRLHSTKKICAKVSENHHPPLHMWSHPDIASGKLSINDMAPEMRLQCDKGHIISVITFASYGNPSGSCQRFARGRCHASSSQSVVSKACLGRNNCTVGVSNQVFGLDPCRGVVKTLAVEAKCKSSTDISAA